MKLYKDHESAETTIAETLLKLKAIWYKTETQMTFLKTIWDSLDANFQANQHLLLSVLETKLREAVRLLSGVIGAKDEQDNLTGILVKRGSLKRIKYAVRIKDSLEGTLSELLQWHNLFDPSWYLVARVPNVDIDRKLESHSKHEAVRLLAGLRKSVRDLNSQTSVPPKPISTNDFLGARVPIKGSSSTTAQIEGRTQYAVVDSMILNTGVDTTATTRSVIALAKALSRMDPSAFGLLRCCGVINKVDRYEFAFEIPRGLQDPRSLRDLLTSYQPTLNVRLDIAKQLANSVLYLHAAGFVHKNVRPETILVFDRGETKVSYLAGFENFRGVTDETFKLGDAVPERELYRHPTRQGNDPERDYTMQHDIYSLGVCLLEIGLWRSFIKQDDQDNTVIEFGKDVAEKNQRARAYMIKGEMLATAEKELPSHVGIRFQNVVEKCLTVLDEQTTWDQVDEKGALEVDVGVEFIENVLLQLHEIVI